MEECGAVWRGMPDFITSFKTKATELPVYNRDQDFLGESVYPLVKNDILAHESVCCEKLETSVSFPTCRTGAEHGGAVLSENEEPRMGDMNVFFSDWTAPPKCTRQAH
jgi:hypothetical protein